MRTLASTFLLLLAGASLAAAETLLIEGSEPERGAFTGRLVLDEGQAGEGGLAARFELHLVDGSTVLWTGAVERQGESLAGTLRRSVGAIGRLAGEAPARVELTARVGDEGWRGTARGAGLSAEFRGRPALERASPRAPERFSAQASPAATPEARRLAAPWRALAGETLVTPLAANGGRPVVVHLPAGFDPAKPVRVVTFLHGHRWDVGPALARQGVLERVRTLGEADPQTVFLFPQAGPAPFATWLEPPGESLRGLAAQALGVAARLADAPALTVTRRVVDAHSGGGLALVNAIDADELVADKVNLIDCAYGSWAQIVARWAANAPNRPRVESWYTHHASQAANNAAAARIAPEQVTTHAAGAVSLHNALPARVLGAD